MDPDTIKYKMVSHRSFPLLRHKIRNRYAGGITGDLKPQESIMVGSIAQCNRAVAPSVLDNFRHRGLWLWGHEIAGRPGREATPALHGVTRTPWRGNSSSEALVRIMIQWKSSQFLAGNLKLPKNSPPA
jgi:hypothetical protein